MKQAHSRYAKSVNRRQAGCGHVWQGRFYSCPLDSAHLYRAVRYVEMNPVRAGLCNDPYEYEWSSAAVHGGMLPACPGVDLAPLGDAWKEMDWTAYLHGREAEAESAEIRACTARGKPWGRPELTHL
jgi:putative transposase